MKGPPLRVASTIRMGKGSPFSFFQFLSTGLDANKHESIYYSHDLYILILFEQAVVTVFDSAFPTVQGVLKS